jgi:hypothetical protein
MDRVLSRSRVVFALLSIVAVFVIVVTLGEEPNSAQERKVDAPKAKFEQFANADALTSDIRDRAREIVRVQFRSIADRENVTKYGRIIQDFGSFVILSKSRNLDMSRSVDGCAEDRDDGESPRGAVRTSRSCTGGNGAA